VRVVRRDGTPARGVAVSVAGEDCETDGEGWARFAAIPVGPQTVLALAHGYLPSFGSAEVGRDAQADVFEATPRRARVVVVDPDGRPVPAVRVLATCRAVPGPAGSEVELWTTIAQMDGVTEVLTPRTDARGEVVLDLPEGRIQFHATLAGAAAKLETDERDVRIVLAPPALPPAPEPKDDPEPETDEDEPPAPDDDDAPPTDEP
jgi:hypothetical protein